MDGRMLNLAAMIAAINSPALRTHIYKDEADRFDFIAAKASRSSRDVEGFEFTWVEKLKETLVERRDAQGRKNVKGSRIYG